ncbi:CRISPR system precrRNA processing endoribonuclease RAMP protein Cas6 [bacterium]|nr:CRISPR system precrRNA processing endoribonuclease RAMP protein Cas6 [bacterium]
MSTVSLDDLYGLVMAQFQQFRAAVYEFRLIPETEIILPRSNKTNVLRGAFGWECRRLVCGSNFENDCTECGRMKSCPYAVIFEPTPPYGAQQLRNYQDIPRPYLFRVEPDQRVHYGKADPIIFHLTLVGTAIEYLPYFIVVFRELGTIGIGVNRGKFQIETIEALDVAACNTRTLIYSCEDNLVRNDTRNFGVAGIEKKVNEFKSFNSVSLRFITPTKLIFQEREIFEPEFHHIFKRQRDRISSLLYFYCGYEPNDEVKELYRLLGELSEKVQTDSLSIQRVEQFRITRRKEHHPLSGFVGEISFSGDLKPFLPFLIAGEALGVGKNTVFGNGWYKICSQHYLSFNT